MKKRLILIMSIIFFGLTSGTLYAWRGSSGGCGYDGYMGPQWFGIFHNGGLFMGIFTLILLGVLIFFGINYFRKNGMSAGGKEKPLEILKIRYAKGEITKDEFDRMKREIAGE